MGRASIRARIAEILNSIFNFLFTSALLCSFNSDISKIMPEPLSVRASILRRTERKAALQGRYVTEKSEADWFSYLKKDNFCVFQFPSIKSASLMCLKKDTP
jgi:hypothetical protein